MDSIGKIVLLLLFIKFTPNAFSKEIPKFRVSTIYHEPFVMRGDNNVGFKGLLIDMLSKLSERLNFTVEYKLATDETFGRVNANGTWSGIIGEVINGKAEIGLAALTMNSMRMRVVKFSIPFMTTGISAIGKGDVFASIEDDPNKILKLAQEGKVQFGIMEGGATKNFFQITTNPLYQNIYKEMQKNPEGFVSTYEQALSKVRSYVEKPFAFFGEKSLFDYYAGKPPCDLKVLTYHPFNVVHYSVAFPINISNEVFDGFNIALSDLLSDGSIQTLKRKYYIHNQCKMFCMHLPEQTVTTE